MIDKLGLDGLGGASVRVEPTPQGTNGVTGKADAGPVVVGLEPVAEYDDHDAELYWRKDFNIPKGITKLYSAPDVARLQAELTAMTQERDWLNHKSKCLEMERVSQEERIATMTEERDNWQRQSSDNWNSAVKNGLMLAAEQVYSAQLREALDICKREMQGDKWDALYIDGVLANK